MNACAPLRNLKDTAKSTTHDDSSETGANFQTVLRCSKSCMSSQTAATRWGRKRLTLEVYDSPTSGGNPITSSATSALSDLRVTTDLLHQGTKEWYLSTPATTE